MGRRHSLEGKPEVRRKVVELYFKEGKSLDRVAEDLREEFGEEAPSRSAIHRLVKRLRPYMRLHESGVLSEEDLDLLAQSGTLSTLAGSLLEELLVESDGARKPIPEERLNALIGLAKTAATLSRTAAYVERTRTQLIRHTEEVFSRVARAVARAVEDPELREKVLLSVRRELEA